MRTKLLSFLILPLLLSSHSSADTVFWDATPGTPDGGSDGGTGTWDTSTSNWDNGATYQTWNNGNNDTAVFGGTAGTVTLGTDITIGGMTFNTNGYSIAAGAGPYSLTLGTATDINVSTGTTDILAEIQGSNTLTKSGSGTLRIQSVSDNFTGNLAITGGTLRVGNNNTTSRLGGATYSGDISIASGSQFWLTNNQSQTFSGVISGAGNLNKGGSGVLTLSGANTYTGKTIIAGSGQGGPGLSVSSFNSVVGGTASSSLGAPTTVANGTIQLGNGGNQRGCSLTYTGSGETTDRVMNVQFNSGSDHTISNTGSGLLTFTSNFQITPSSGNTGSTLRLRGSGNGDIAQIGTIPGLLDKLDGGTWAVGGTNGFNAVTVSGGALVNNGSFNVTTAVTVNNGTTLTAGYITAASMTLGGTSNLNMDLGGTTLGTEYDNITLSGAMTYGGNLSIADVGAFDIDAASQVYDLFGLASASGDFASVTVNGIGLTNSSGTWSGVNGDSTYVFEQSTGDLAVTVIPEPSVAILGSLGLLCLLRRRR